MGAKEFEGNRRELLKLCQDMGVMDHFSELVATAMDQQTLMDSVVFRDGVTRSHQGGIFITRMWIREQIKRIGRGPQPDKGLFDSLE